jgi:hypothetical protein
MTTGPFATRLIYDRLRSLEVGEGFTLAYSEWKVATPPDQNILSNPKYAGRFTISPSKDSKGWLIARIK